jgi:serine/threonine protein kinase
VCHLDISLENLLLSDQDVVKICDFGLARELVPKKVTSATDDGNERDGLQTAKNCLPEFELFRGAVGKNGYAAPEVFANAEYDGRKADVFSLGVVLFCMLTGLPPWSQPTASDKRFEMIVMKGELRKLLQMWNRSEDVSPDAEDLLKHMLCDSKRRFYIDQVLQHPFLKEDTSSDKSSETAQVSPSSTVPTPMQTDTPRASIEGNSNNSNKSAEKETSTVAAMECTSPNT